MNGAVLAVMPTIKQIPMGRVTRLPEWYPDTVGGPFTVYGFVIGHPNGLIVVDAGIGVGNTLIDDLYAPITVDVPQAVAHALNTRPRKVLGWKTPAEAFDDHLRSLQQAGVATTG